MLAGIEPASAPAWAGEQGSGIVGRVSGFAADAAGLEIGEKEHESVGGGLSLLWLGKPGLSLARPGFDVGGCPRGDSRVRTPAGAGDLLLCWRAMSDGSSW